MVYWQVGPVQMIVQADTVYEILGSLKSPSQIEFVPEWTRFSDAFRTIMILILADLNIDMLNVMPTASLWFQHKQYGINSQYDRFTQNPYVSFAPDYDAEWFFSSG